MCLIKMGEDTVRCRKRGRFRVYSIAMSAALSLPRPLANVSTEDDTPGFLRIPAEAHTLDGFRRWALSDEFPEKLKVMFLAGEVYFAVVIGHNCTRPSVSSGRLAAWCLSRPCY